MGRKWTDPGFDSTNAVTAGLPIVNTRFPESDQLNRYLRQIKENIGALPGVRGVALTSAREGCTARRGDQGNHGL